MSDAFQDTPPAFGDGEEDPAADFLAREQDELAGLDDGDDFGLNGTPATGAQAEGDLVTDSQFDAFTEDPVAEDVSQFEPTDSGFGMTAMNMNTALQDEALDFGSDPMQNGFEAADSSSYSPYSAISSMDRLQVEPEKIKRWREEQKQMLEEKDAAEEKHIDELKEAARKELEDWYRHRDEQLEKTKSTNRAAEEAYVKEIEDKEPGSEFERICRLCDFNPKNSKNTRDVSRFRSILLQLKQGGLIKSLQ